MVTISDQHFNVRLHEHVVNVQGLVHVQCTVKMFNLLKQQRFDNFSHLKYDFLARAFISFCVFFFSSFFLVVTVRGLLIIRLICTTVYI